MRQLLLVAALAAAATACGTPSSASPGAASPSPPASPASSGPTVQLLDFSVQPAALSAPSGTTITVVNAGKAPHNLWIRDAGGRVLARTANLEPGRRTTLKLDLPPGAYVDYCQEPGHESLGMMGSLSIT